MTERDEVSPPDEASEDEVWPPAGFNSYYTTTERIEGRPDLTFDFVLPSTFEEVNLATVRIGRHGGPNAADAEFRAELYARVGAITVAAGHVETAMKRLILVMESAPKARFSTVDKQWSELHRRLERIANKSDERSRQLGAVLGWGEENGVKRRRDNTIHAYWWTYAGCGARRSRFVRKSDGATILASLADLDEDANLLFDYAERLDALLGGDWVLARLPKD